MFIPASYDKYAELSQIFIIICKFGVNFFCSQFKNNSLAVYIGPNTLLNKPYYILSNDLMAVNNKLGKM